MGQNTILETRGAPLYIGGQLLEGQVNTNVPGGTSQRFPVGDVLDEVRRFVNDIPDSGTATVTFNLNPADPLHEALRGYQENNTILKFEWWISGKKVNGVNSKNATELGKVTVASVAKNTGKLVYTAFNQDQPRVGDFLVPGTGDTLKIASADYSATKTLNATKSDGKKVSTAVSASTKFDLRRPAQQVVFSAQISGIPSGGDRVVVATMQLNIIGKVTYKVGNPNIT